MYRGRYSELDSSPLKTTLHNKICLAFDVDKVRKHCLYFRSDYLLSFKVRFTYLTTRKLIKTPNSGHSPAVTDGWTRLGISRFRPNRCPSKDFDDRYIVKNITVRHNVVLSITPALPTFVLPQLKIWLDYEPPKTWIKIISHRYQRWHRLRSFFKNHIVMVNSFWKISRGIVIR